MINLETILQEIAQHGSVRKAAIALSISPQAISKRFKKLSDDDPLKVQYLELAPIGRTRKWKDDRERVREAVRRHRAKSDPPLDQALPPT